jgi:hydroxyacylglutathione hydrolase
VNSYLVKAATGFILLDTGFPALRDDLDAQLEEAGCRPGDLALIVLTHGDHDHAGNGAYLRDKYGARIAMHDGDLPMVERGDMAWNRSPKRRRLALLFTLIQTMAPAFTPGEFEPFHPDLLVGEGYDLAPYGLAARVLHLPGHSKGSIGILTAGGDLFCGDLLYNIFGAPGCEYMDNLPDYDRSMDKLKALHIGTVYPGHGKPFPMSELRGTSS